MKKRRENSFFGIHYDFHALEGQSVAEIYRPEGVAEVLDRVKPDFVQCDTKGHAGYSSYPTKAGTQAFEIKEDVLKMWRDLTAERDIALYGHHSGLYDMMVCKNHPDWAVVDENGVVSDSYVSPFSPYVDEILLPQIKELALDYNLDGAWIDGECWGSFVDYSSWATKAYKEATGKAPARRGDADYEEYREFCREGFLGYVCHYVEEIKKVKPDFQITSNWIFSAYMPQEPCVDVDFLSGDYATSNSMQSARINSRAIACHEKVWDLITWGQNANPCSWITRDRTEKEEVQYCHEAAEVISTGGAIMFFNIMYGYGGCVQEWMIPTWENVAKFIRERQDICHKSKILPEIGIVYAEEKTSHTTDSLYDQQTDGLVNANEWIFALQNNQFSTSIISEYQLKSDADKFKVIVLAGTKHLKPESAEILADYVKNGGTVICDMPSLGYFEKYTGLNSFYTDNKLIFVDGGGTLSAIQTDLIDLDSEDGKDASYYDDNIYQSKEHTLTVIKNHGKGKFLCFGFDFAGSYKTNQSASFDDFIKNRMKAIGFEPKAKILNNSYVDVITATKGNKLLVNLINYSGPHMLSKVRTYRELPKLCDIDVEISLDKDPGEVYLEPGHKKLDYTYENGKVKLRIDRLDVHLVVTAEF